MHCRSGEIWHSDEPSFGMHRHFDNAIFLAASYAAMSDSWLSATVAKVSTDHRTGCGICLRDSAPFAAVLGMRSLTEADSVTLQGMDLFAAGGLVNRYLHPCRQGCAFG